MKGIKHDGTQGPPKIQLFLSTAIGIIVKHGYIVWSSVLDLKIDIPVASL